MSAPEREQLTGGVPTAAPADGGRQGPGGSTAEASAVGADSRRARTTATVPVLIVLLVLTQRFGIPVGETTVSLTIPITYACALYLLVSHRAAISRLRLELYALGTTAVLAVTAVASLQGAPVNLTSLGLLAALYLPWTVRTAQDVEGTAHRAAKAFISVMTVLAVVGVLQLTSQLLGLWRYEDYVLTFVGPDFLMPGFNTSNPLVYASTTYKANAFVMLEPSFMSQFCGLAVLLGVVLRIRAWQLLTLLAGLASAVSGTGILLLVAGGLLILVRAWRTLQLGQIAAAGAAVALVVISPVGPLLLDRSDETTQQGSSGYLRFVQPYLESFAGLDAEPVRYVVGAGSGTADRLLTSERAGQLGEAVVYTIVPKLSFEYGLVAGGLFAIFLLVSMLDGAVWRVVPGTLVVMTFFLSGGLLQPHTAYLAWLLTGFVSREAPAGRSPRPPAPR